MEFHTIHTFQSMKNIIKRHIAKEQPSHTPIGVGNSIHFMLLYYPWPSFCAPFGKAEKGKKRAEPGNKRIKNKLDPDIKRRTQDKTANVGNSGRDFRRDMKPERQKE